MPQQTFQGFDLGVRKNAAMGGLQELDMRMGGPSVGPGTGTSDDIPAMLSDGEFVVNAAAVRGIGIQAGADPSDEYEQRLLGAREMYEMQKLGEEFAKKLT